MSNVLAEDITDKLLQNATLNEITLRHSFGTSKKP